VQALTDNVNQLILDYQGIVITGVQQSSDGTTFNNITYSKADGRWGSALSANLQSGMLIFYNILI
jgi:hypothetical protein